jgi:hypothetical protein
MRERVAQDIYEAFDFGCPVVDQTGWETTTPGEDFVLTSYTDPEDGPEDATVPIKFVVEFKPGSAVVNDVTAYAPGGNPTGRLSLLRLDQAMAAQLAADAYDFGYRVQDGSDWFWSSCDVGFKVVQLVGNGDQDSLAAIIRVVFNPSTNIPVEVQAYDAHDNPLGKPGAVVA